MRYLLDTCVISELVSKNPNENVVQWLDGAEEGLLYLSVITIGEVKKGIEKLADSERKRELVGWLENEVRLRFKERLLPINEDVMLAWGMLVARLEQAGMKMPAIDSFIAAQAIEGEFKLVTRNEADFENTGLEIINPWKLKT